MNEQIKMIEQRIESVTEAIHGKRLSIHSQKELMINALEAKHFSSDVVEGYFNGLKKLEQEIKDLEIERRTLLIVWSSFNPTEIGKYPFELN